TAGLGQGVAATAPAAPLARQASAPGAEGGPVSPRAVSRQALAEAGNVLRGLSSARQVYTLYPSRHPKRLEAVQETLEAILRLRRALRDDPVLFVARHALYLGPTLLPRDSLSRYGLVDALEKARIDAVEP